MAFVPDAKRATVNLIVVAFGINDRIVNCVEHVVAHESDTDFAVTVVVNPRPRQPVPDVSRLPAGIALVQSDFNLGWPAGLHLGRRQVEAEFLGFIEDDMLIRDGWLDELMTAMREDDKLGLAGCPNVSEDGHAIPVSSGFTPNADTWLDAQATRAEDTASGPVVARGWIAGRGMFVREQVIVETGGPDPRCYPVWPVDRTLCLHVRAHGWTVAMVPTAHVQHNAGTSAPRAFRDVIKLHRVEYVRRRWDHVVEQLGPVEARPVEHDCDAHFATAPFGEIELAVGREAAQLVVAMLTGDLDEEGAARELLSSVSQTVRRLERRVESMERSASWRVTAPLRAVMRAIRR